MKKARLFLGAISSVILIAGALAFKIQHGFVGQYVCASTYNGEWFDNFYTTINPTVTLYCTLVPSLPKTRTFKVAVNA